MIAAGLCREKRPRTILDALGQNFWRRFREHDVGNLDPGTARRPARETGFVRIAEHPGNLRHGGKLRRIDLGGATGDDDFRVGPLALDAANGLPRLPDRFCCHRAGVDNDKIGSLASRGGAPHRLGLDKIEPAAEGQDLDVLWFAPPQDHAAISLKRLGSSRVSNSNATGPVIVTWPSLSRHSISRSPPGRLTMALWPVRPFRAAATRAAQAADPQARVRPVPRSQTFSAMCAREVTWASEILARSGNIG